MDLGDKLRLDMHMEKKLKKIKNTLFPYFPSFYTLMFFLVLSSIFFWSYFTIFSFKSLPSPLYGGDYYYQLGQIFYMYQNNFFDWFKTSNGIGERPAYFPIYGIVTTIIGKILMKNPVEAMFYSSLLYTTLSTFIFYILLKFIYKRDDLSLIGSLYYVYSLNPWVFKYTEFTSLIIFPLFLYSLLKFIETKSLKNAIILGFLYGLSLLSHSTTIVTFSSFLVFSILYYSVKISKEKKSISIENKNLLIYGALAFLIGFLIGQIYWFKPIFIYKGISGLKSYLWSLEDYSNLSFSFGFGIDMMLNFFSIKTPLDLLKFLIPFSLYFSYKEKHPLFIITSLSFLITYSYLFLSPLFKLHFLPSYQFNLYLSKLFILSVPFALKRIKFYENLNEKKKKIVISFLFILLLFSIHLKQGDLEKYNSIKVAKKFNIPPYLLEMSKYIVEKTDKNAVFLSNNELSFSLNALTGRKLMISRRAQNDAFVQDFDRRVLDAAIIFYGNDPVKRKELLKKYNVSYLYYEPSWSFLEFENIGKDISKMTIKDPLLIVYSKEYEDELKKYGIKYIRTYFYIDPSVRNENTRLFDVLIISPENYDRSGLGPWKDDLDRYLTLSWGASEKGAYLAVLHKVNLDN